MDFIPFVVNDERNPNPTTDYKLTATFAKKLAIGTHNFKGEAAKNYFIKVEDKLKELVKPQSIEDLIILQAQSMKDMRQQLNQVNHNALQAQHDVQAIRETIVIVPDDWRDYCNKTLNKISYTKGVDYNTIKTQSYEALDSKGCDLNRRLDNRRKRGLELSASKSVIDKYNKLDCIADDKKLIDMYVNIVKQMAIKYGIA